MDKLTDRDYRKHRDRFESLLQTWAPMVCPGWKIKLICHNGPVPDHVVSGLPPASYIATFQGSWCYLEACINASIPAVSTRTDAELREDVIHELMHATVNELRENVKDWLLHEERVVTLLARAMVDAYEYGRGHPLGPVLDYMPDASVELDSSAQIPATAG